MLPLCACQQAQKNLTGSKGSHKRQELLFLKGPSATWEAPFLKIGLDLLVLIRTLLLATLLCEAFDKVFLLLINTTDNHVADYRLCV